MRSGWCGRCGPSWAPIMDCAAGGDQLGYGVESVRQWVRQATSMTAASLA